MSILLVEDDSDTADAIAESLREGGYVVDVVPDGAAALGYLAGRPPPALIVLDLALPVVDGPEFRRRQRDMPAVASVPVLAISARPDAARFAAGLGISACLS